MSQMDDSNNIASFQEYYDRQTADELYREYDRNASNLISENAETTYSERGRSIMDDMQYFLTHAKYKDAFEREFLNHLKVFSRKLLDDE